MASTVRLSAEGIRLSTDRIRFLRDCEFSSAGSDNAYNFDVGDGSVVTDGDVTISGNLTVNSPGVLKELGVSEGYKVVQTVRITNTAAPALWPFRAAADGVIYSLSAVYWTAEAGDTDQFWIYLSNGSSVHSEHPVKFGPTVGGWAAAAVAYADPIPADPYPNDRALAPVSRGDLRYLLSWPFSTAASDCTVIIEIDPTSES